MSPAWPSKSQPAPFFSGAAIIVCGGVNLTNSPSRFTRAQQVIPRSEEHTSELQSPCNLVCRLLLDKKEPQRPARAPAAVCDRQHRQPDPDRIEERHHVAFAATAYACRSRADRGKNQAAARHEDETH